jgi:hypothetical protein
VLAAIANRAGLLTAALALAGALTWAAGCSAPVDLAPVDGTLTAGGTPLANVLVTFLPETNGEAAHIRSLAVTDNEGRFRLQTEKQKEGAVVGRHRVIVEDLSIHSAPRSADGTVLTMPTPRFSADYTNPLTSPLTAEVSAGPQTIQFELKPSP